MLHDFQGGGQATGMGGHTGMGAGSLSGAPPRVTRPDWTSPASIEVVRELVRLKGGSGDDVAKLPRGQFYVHDADAGFPAPAKISVPLCLSRHPENPLDETQILQKACGSRHAGRERTVSAGARGNAPRAFGRVALGGVLLQSDTAAVPCKV